MSKPKTLRICEALLDIYSPAALSFLMTMLLLPYIYRSLPPPDWHAFATILTAAGLTTLFDFGVTQNIYRDLATRSSSEAHQNTVAGYFLVAGTLALPVAACSALYVSPSGLTTWQWALTVAWLALQYLSFPLISALQGIKKNRFYAGIFATAACIKTISIVYFLGSPQSHSSALTCAIFSYLLASAAEVTLYCITLVKSDINCHGMPIRGLIGQIASSQFIYRSSVILSGSIVAQLDRLLLVHLLPSDRYAEYLLLSTFCLMFLALQYPAMRYFAPRYLTGPQKTQNAAFVSLATFIAGAIFILASHWTFSRWSGKPLNPDMSTGLTCLATGTALQAMYNVYYQILLLDGKWRQILITNITSATITASFVLSPLSNRDTTLGGIIWIIFSAAQIAAYLIFNINRRKR